MKKEEFRNSLPDKWKGIFDVVESNQQKLNSCTRHDFSIEVSDVNPFTKRFKCTHCDGEISASEKRWYDRGLSHAKGSDE